MREFRRENTNMKMEWIHPSEQLVTIMNRIYRYGMTTTSGGNLSILDDDGDIWITPAGIDKGSLTPRDIVRVKADGTHDGIHQPSSELPFHELIYKARPDIRSIIHAHTPSLVTFSILRKVPNHRFLPDLSEICGKVGIAKYALPGSQQLGKNIAEVFSQGSNAVILENHGVVIGSNTIIETFKILELLDLSAKLEINANRLGRTVMLSDLQLEFYQAFSVEELLEYQHSIKNSEELYAREELIKLIHRSYDQRLFSSTQGTFSERLDSSSFLITPHAVDRKTMRSEDLVRIEGDRRESGKFPSRAVKLHKAIYDQHPHVNSIIIAHPPNITAFAITNTEFESRTIPESYILLRNVKKLPFGVTQDRPETVAQHCTIEQPVVLVKNDGVVVTAQSALQAFDRLEVIEYNAEAIIASKDMGNIISINNEQIKEIELAFFHNQ